MVEFFNTLQAHLTSLKTSIVLAAAGGTAIAVAAVLFAVLPDAGQPAASPTTAQSDDAVPAPFVIMETDGTKHIIPLDQIRSGGVAMDGIPSVDEPVFAEPDQAPFLEDSDIVMGLEIGGDARAYPLFILVWHEIVNDMVGGVPVSVTYCPLCYTTQVFERTINGQEVEFGTSGKLYNSNLLMYDRLTGSYWSQGLGVAVTGDLSGSMLRAVPFDVITWGDWKRLHPDSMALTTQTGHARPYGVDPYGEYYTDSRIFFPISHRDDTLGLKDVVMGLSAGHTYKAYRQADIEAEVLINDQIDGKPVLLASLFPGNARVFDRTVDGQALEFEYVDRAIMDTSTGSEWDYGGTAVSGELAGERLERLSASPGFWFEWAAFHPDTLVYGVD